MSKRTPLYDTHRALGARLIEFGGWDMPVQYSGILAEHHAVRTKAGLFDLSHMGEIEVSGPRALEALQELVVTDVARVQLGQAQYSVMCYPDGGIVDDIIIYRVAQENYLLCVNASNTAKDFEWMTQHNHAQATMIDRSDEYALIAVQGPSANAIVRQLTPLDLSQV
jgi:aminomethyltransferase